MEAEIEQKEGKIDEIENRVTAAGMGRKEKRKLLKKLKRKQLRKETAIKEKEIEEAASNDPKVQARLLQLEREETERMERDRIEFEERERQFVLDLERRKRELEEEARKQDEDEANRGLVIDGNEYELNEGDDWEYVEEGPAEIIWKGNEIIVKKKKVKVPKKVLDLQKEKQESERPISNPLAPQSEAFNDYKSAQEVLESVAREVPNFGTEKDKAHCPFHLKTGVCRFGVRCSRAHFYPDKSSTLLFKNMYNGPGLAWEQDEGLEHMEEEVERCFEEFYEDVHTEFLKFGEIINFKVCKNASSHLRGNVYVHYKFLEPAVLAYQSTNGRYFAGKQLSCEFVNLTKWKVAICGEYMKSRLKACSRGSACNFIHCFRNPGGDYEWADWDKPAPRYWLKEMGALFGHTGDRSPDGSLRYHSKRSRSRDPDSCHRENHSDDDDDDHRIRYLQRHRGHSEEKISPPENHRTKRRKTDSVSKRDCRSEEHKYGHGNSDSKCYRDLKSTSPVRPQREHRAKKSNESSKRERSDRSHAISGRYSSRKKSEFESVHEYHRRNEKLNDMKKSPPQDRHLSKYCGHEYEDSWQKKKESFSSGIDSLEDTLQRDKNMRHSYKSLCMKDEANISTSNSLSEYMEYKSKSDSMERDQDKYQHRSANRSKAMKNILKSALDGGRTETDEKRPEKNRGESIRSENQEDFTDSESERLQGRANRKRHSSTKNRKHEAESSGNSSDGGTSRRYEKKSKKKRKTKSRSKSDSNILDGQGSLISRNKKEGDDGFGDRNTVLYVECGSLCKSPGDCNGVEGKELADGEKRTCIDIKHVSPMNISNGETCSRATNCQNFDGEAEDDLEQTYRMAALKKLEEMRKCKATVSVHSHENITVENAESGKDVEEISPTREAGISSASVRRKRI